MFHEKLDQFLVSTAMIVSGYDDGYFVLPPSHYMTKSYLYVLGLLQTDSPNTKQVLEAFKKLSLEIYQIDGPYRYEEIRKVMNKHKESIKDFLDDSLWQGVETAVHEQYKQSKEAHESRWRQPEGCSDVNSSIAEQNVLDEILEMIMMDFPEKDLSKEQPVSYPCEPFSNIKIQFDEFGKSARIEFEYLGSQVSFRTKADPRMLHGAYAYSDEGSYNQLCGGYIEDNSFDVEKESIVGAVLRYFLVMGRKMAMKCNSSKTNNSILRKIEASENPHTNIFSIWEDFDQLSS